MKESRNVHSCLFPLSEKFKCINKKEETSHISLLLQNSSLGIEAYVDCEDVSKSKNCFPMFLKEEEIKDSGFVKKEDDLNNMHLLDFFVPKERQRLFILPEHSRMIDLYGIKHDNEIFEQGFRVKYRKVVEKELDLKNKSEFYLIRENYAQFLTFTHKWLKERKDKQDLAWIDQSHPLFSNKDFKIIPHFKYDEEKDSKFHFLAFTKNTSILSLRDLNGEHLKSLMEIYKKGMDIICKKLNKTPRNVRVYIHYPPSIARLHIHFQDASFYSSSVITGRAVLLEDIINNISVESNYYQKRTLVFQQRCDSELYQRFKPLFD